MIFLALVIGIVLLASAGFAMAMKKYFPKSREEYFLPIGFACLLSLLQFGYYPAMFFHWHSRYEHFLTLLVLLVGLVLAFHYRQAVSPRDFS